MENKSGMLYLCATPIGNLEDITLRVLRTLEEADIIFCEDTRNSLKLLRHFDISKPLSSYHDHSPESRALYIADLVRDGKQVALISDAGMPVISDPGFDLVNTFRAQNLPYTVLPGPSASLTALVMSGLPSGRFVFEGFLPRKKKDIDNRLSVCDAETGSTIFYESPHRIDTTLEIFAKRWPDRALAAVREISKRFEEVIRGTTQEVLAHFKENVPRGEFVLILGPAVQEAQSEEDKLETAIDLARRLVEEEGYSTNQAAKEAAAKTRQPKRAIYQALLEDA